MGWRDRLGADDERARIAARARALLDAAGTRPSPGGSLRPDVEAHGAAPTSPVPPPRGGWVPPSIVPPSEGPAPAAPPPARHAAEVAEPLPLVLGPIDPDGSVYRRPWRERFRVDPGRRGLVAIAAVVVVIGSVAGGVMFHGGRSAAVTLAAASGAAAPSAASDAPLVSAAGSAGSSAAAAPSGSASASSSATGEVTVDVAGLVAHPGVYTLPAGSRVEDALRAAGGAKPGADLSSLNRARVLVDGEQVAVGVNGAVAPGTAVAPSGGTPGGLVDLNTATLAGLDTLPGVGPVLAQKILDWRTEHGRFGSVDDLQNVSGIGPTRFADLKDLVTV